MGLTNFSGDIGGLTHMIRVRQIEPTDPTPVAGDWYFNQATSYLYIHNGSGWCAILMGTSTSTTSTSTSSTSTSTTSTSTSTTSTSTSLTTSSTSSSSTSTT